MANAIDQHQLLVRGGCELAQPVFVYRGNLSPGLPQCGIVGAEVAKAEDVDLMAATLQASPQQLGGELGTAWR